MFPEKTKGRGLMHIEGTYTTEITTLEKHIERKENPLIQIVILTAVKRDTTTAWNCSH
jgi:hypothetical protein